MLHTYKVLSQTALAATTSTDLYTVPAATSAVVSSIVICNRGAVVASVRLSVAIAGAVLATSQYIYFDVLMPPNDTLIFTGGVTLATTDKVRGYASTANVSMTLFGEELS